MTEDAQSGTVGYQCDVDGCDSDIVGIDDGWEYSRGLVCSDCIEYNREHGHWPDEDSNCPTCMREVDGNA